VGPKNNWSKALKYDAICTQVPQIQDGPGNEPVLAAVAPSVDLFKKFQSY